MFTVTECTWRIVSFFKVCTSLKRKCIVLCRFFPGNEDTQNRAKPQSKSNVTILAKMHASDSEKNGSG